MVTAHATQGRPDQGQGGITLPPDQAGSNSIRVDSGLVWKGTRRPLHRWHRWGGRTHSVLPVSTRFSKRVACALMLPRLFLFHGLSVPWAVLLWVGRGGHLAELGVLQDGCGLTCWKPVGVSPFSSLNHILPCLGWSVRIASLHGSACSFGKSFGNCSGAFSSVAAVACSRIRYWVGFSNFPVRTFSSHPLAPPPGRFLSRGATRIRHRAPRHHDQRRSRQTPVRPALARHLVLAPVE